MFYPFLSLYVIPYILLNKDSYLVSNVRTNHYLSLLLRDPSFDAKLYLMKEA